MFAPILRPSLSHLIRAANLIDSPAASTLGMHRALFHNEHYGTLETFRPYALPDDAWLAEAGRRLPR